MKKILVLGKTGMLGHVLYNYLLEKGYDVVGTSRKEEIIYDANNNMESIEQIVKFIKPDVVINCIGILNKNAEENKEEAYKVNSYLPNYIYELSKKLNFKFIHISSDCVFDGMKGKYTEEDIPNAKTIYGQTKAKGEIKSNDATTIRTSIIGPDINENGIGLFQWFMNQKNEVNGYSNVMWSGVTTIELSKCIEKIIINEIYGLQHVVNNKFISKYELLKLFKKYFDKDIIINKDENIISDKTLVRTSKSYNFNIPSYDKMIIDMSKWIENHYNLYENKFKVRRLTK